MGKGLRLTAALALVLFLLTMVLGILQDQGRLAAGRAYVEERPALILDAGHGGEDGGAVSVTGVPESGINLDIVLKLNDLLAFCGTVPIPLRCEDISLHSPEAATLREKKVSDLKNRVAAIQSMGGTPLLSIHQNSFPEGKYRGTQVFYAPTEGSNLLADHIQKTVRAALQPDNGRECKPIPESVYLMNHIDCPAVLVECGFLTNAEEEALLRDAGYQRKLAAVLTAAWLTAEKK